MPRPLVCAVSPQALAHNISVLRAQVPSSECMAIIKADAYGHGIERLFEGLNGADKLGLLEIDKARQLRRLGWAKPIVLIEGCFEDRDVQQALGLQCDWVVHRQGQVDQLRAQLPKLQGSAHKPTLYIKFNTGMNRLGFDLTVAEQTIRAIDEVVDQADLPGPVLMSHYANADVGAGSQQFVQVQDQFNALQQILPAQWKTSLGNSAAVLNWPAFVGDISRPGIALYGATPGPQSAKTYGLKPAMQLNSEVIDLHVIPQGGAVGYGSRFVAKKETTVAVVACGYADGYPRHAPDGTPVWVKGQRCALAGRVSMDMLTVDVTHVEDVEIGSPVQLWGEHIPVDEVAVASGTIGYELLCAVAARVPFVVDASSV